MNRGNVFLIGVISKNENNNSNKNNNKYNDNYDNDSENYFNDNNGNNYENGNNNENDNENNYFELSVTLSLPDEIIYLSPKNVLSPSNFPNHKECSLKSEEKLFFATRIVKKKRCLTPIHFTDSSKLLLLFLLIV